MKYVALGEVARIVSGATPATHEPRYWNGDIPWITPADLSNHQGIYFSKPTRKISRAGYDSCSTELLDAGTIVFSSRAPIGHCAVLKSPACTNQGFKSVVPKPNLDSIYGFFVLKYLTPKIVSLGRGATFLEINKETFENVLIPLPSLEEQRRIAGILEWADRLRRLRLHALEISDTYLQSVFLEMFGDKQNDRTTMSEVLSKAKNSIRTGPFGSQLLHSEFVDAGVAVLGIDNAVQNRFVWAKPRFITPKKYEEMKRYTVYPKDIIVTIMGTVGRSAIVPNAIPEAINSKHLCCMTLDLERFAPEFIHACFLYHPPLLKQLKDTQRGAIMDGLNMELIKSLEIPLPPLELQRKFARVVQRYERLRAQQLEGVRLAQGLYDALLHDAFADA